MSRGSPRLAIRTADPFGQTATVLGEKADKSVHALEVWPVVEVSAVAAADHQSRLYQALQVKGQGRGGQTQTPDQFGGRIPLGSALYQQPIYAETRLGGERAQGFDGFIWFHFSKYMELQEERKSAGRSRKSGVLGREFLAPQ